MSPSGTRDWKLYADDIARACAKIRRFVAGLDYAAFANDDRTQDAVIRNLEIIGEAAKRLPEEVKSNSPQIPWRLVCGMRDVVAHGYFGVSLRVVWDTATTQIEELENAARAMLT